MKFYEIELNVGLFIACLLDLQETKNFDIIG